MKEEKKVSSIRLNGILNTIKQMCHILIPFITFTYLARVLGSEAYGKFSFSNSVISYFLLIGMLGISTYAIREGARIRDNKELLTSFSAEVFSINIVFTIIALIALLVVTILSSKINSYKLYILLLSLIIPSTCLGREWVNTIFEDYLYITIRYIIIQVVGVIAVFIFVHGPRDVVVYTLLYTITSSIGFYVNMVYTQKYVPIRITFSVNFRKHFIPIFILFCGQVAVTIYIQSDITMIGFLCDDKDVGIYSIASKIYVIIKSIVNAVTTVTIPRLVSYLGAKNEEKFSELSKKVSSILILLVVPLSLGLALESRNIILIIGGNEYIPGLNTLIILSLALPFAVLSGFYCNAVLVPKRREKAFMVITMIAATLNIVGNFILIPLVGMSGAAITTVISESIVCILCIGYNKTSYISIRFKDLFSLVLASLSVVGICLFTTLLDLSVIISFIFSCVTAAISYFIILFLLKNNILINLIPEKIMKKISKRTE